jgi:hypothetical protein
LHGWHAGVCVAQIRRVGILNIVVGERSLFSQMAVVSPATVPLWKVIAGPAPAKTATGPARVRFSFSEARACCRSRCEQQLGVDGIASNQLPTRFIASARISVLTI